MSALDAHLVGRFMVFTLVLARTGTLVLSAPVFSYRSIPLRVRVLLAITMSLLVTGLYTSTSLPLVEDLGGYALLLAREAMVGLFLGVGVNILLAGVFVAGQLVSQLSGVSPNEVFSAGANENVTAVSQLFYLLTLVVFVAVGGHRLMTEALLDTFAWAPPGHATLGDTYVEVLTGILTQSFVLGIRAAAPILIALLVPSLALGLVGRTLPQINAVTVGFGVNSLLMLGLLFLSLGAVAWTFQEPMVDVLYQLQEVLR